MKRIVSLLTLVSLFVVVNAADFHGSALYNLNGPVKNVKVKKADAFYKQLGNCKFDKNGKIKGNMFTYNESGYPLGYSLNSGRFVFEIAAEYSADNQPTNVRYHDKTSRQTMTIKCANTYDGEKLVKQSITIQKNGKTGYVDYVFSDELNDTYGNWTERTVNATLWDDENPEKKQETFREVREIKYYDLSK